MNHHYFLCRDLVEISVAEQELFDKGFDTSQVYVFSYDQEGVERNHLIATPSPETFEQEDAHFRGISWGLMMSIGLIGVAILLSWPGQMGSLALLIFCITTIFCTTALSHALTYLKTQKTSERLKSAVAKGKHILIVNSLPTQEKSLEHIHKRHPKLHELALMQSSTLKPLH